MKTQRDLFRAIASACLLSLLAAGCGGGAPAAAPASATPSGSTSGSGPAPAGGTGTAASAAGSGGCKTTPGTGGTAIGFIFVGAENDGGYNQAAYIGSQAVQKAFPHMKILRAENIPETQQVAQVMEDMIQQGARIIFPTSYGYLNYAIQVGKQNPCVIFEHQGGLKNTSNVGTYFGNIWQAVYLAGIAAGKMTKTNKLGFVAGFPIPQVLLNINAFELGARSVDPKATTSVIFSSAWCDPPKLTAAALTLIGQGVDVLTQHQDCAKTIVETAERHGVMSVGYHADDSTLAPKGWITAGIWNWGPLYVKIVKTILAGKWAGSPFDAKWRGGLSSGVVTLAPFGAAVPQSVRTLVLQREKQIESGQFDPFAGPIVDRQGKVEIKSGVRLNENQLEQMNYLVPGVVGNIPKQ